MVAIYVMTYPDSFLSEAEQQTQDPDYEYI